MANFSDYIWALALGNSKTPYDPNNTLFTKSDEIAKERRAEAANARAAENQYRKQLELEGIRARNAEAADVRRESAAAKRRKEEMDYQSDLYQKSRDDTELNKSIAEINRQNAGRTALYANADAALKHVGLDAGFKIDPNREPEENEARAELAISRANAMAYRYHENQIKEEQDKLRELQEKLFEARTPTDAEVGPAVNVVGMPRSITASTERQNLLRAGKIEKAIAGLPAADAAQLLAEVARVREDIGALKVKSMAPQINAINAQINALQSRNAASTQKGKDMRDAVSSGKPVWMLVPSEAFRGGPARSETPTALGPATSMPDAVERDGHLSAPSFPVSSMPGPGMPPDRGAALAAGMSALGIDPASIGGISDSIGAAFADGLGAQASAGIPLHDRSFLGIPFRDDPARTTELAPAIGSAIQAAPQVVAGAVNALSPENIRMSLDSLAAPVRNAGNAIGAFLNPQLATPAPQPALDAAIVRSVMDRIPPVQLPSDGSFVPHLPIPQAPRSVSVMDRIPPVQLPSTNSFIPFIPPQPRKTPAETLNDYLMLLNKYGDVTLPSGNSFPFAR